MQKGGKLSIYTRSDSISFNVS